MSENAVVIRKKVKVEGGTWGVPIDADKLCFRDDQTCEKHYSYELCFKLENEQSIRGFDVCARVEVNGSEVHNRIVFKRGKAEAAVGCIHTAIGKSTVEGLEQAVSMEKLKPEERQKIGLSPEAHFESLQSYVQGIAEFGIENMMRTGYHSEGIDPTQLPFGFNSALQKQVLEALREIDAGEADAMVKNVVLDIINTAPKDWVQSRYRILDEMYRIGELACKDAALLGALYAEVITEEGRRESFLDECLAHPGKGMLPMLVSLRTGGKYKSVEAFLKAEKPENNTHLYASIVTAAVASGVDVGDRVLRDAADDVLKKIASARDDFASSRVLEAPYPSEVLSYVVTSPSFAEMSKDWEEWTLRSALDVFNKILGEGEVRPEVFDAAIGFAELSSAGEVIEERRIRNLSDKIVESKSLPLRLLHRVLRLPGVKPGNIKVAENVNAATALSAVKAAPSDSRALVASAVIEGRSIDSGYFVNIAREVLSTPQDVVTVEGRNALKKLVERAISSEQQWIAIKGVNMLTGGKATSIRELAKLPIVGEMPKLALEVLNLTNDMPLAAQERLLASERDWEKWETIVSLVSKGVLDRSLVTKVFENMSGDWRSNRYARDIVAGIEKHYPMTVEELLTIAKNFSGKSEYPHELTTYIISRPDTPSSAIEFLKAASKNPEYVIMGLAKRRDVAVHSEYILARASDISDMTDVWKILGENENTPPALVDAVCERRGGRACVDLLSVTRSVPFIERMVAAHAGDSKVITSAARNPAIPATLLERLIDSADDKTLFYIAEGSALTASAVSRVVEASRRVSEPKRIISALAENDNISVDAALKMVEWEGDNFGYARHGLYGNKVLRNPEVVAAIVSRWGTDDVVDAAGSGAYFLEGALPIASRLKAEVRRAMALNKLNKNADAIGKFAAAELARDDRDLHVLGFIASNNATGGATLLKLSRIKPVAGEDPDIVRRIRDIARNRLSGGG